MRLVDAGHPAEVEPSSWSAHDQMLRLARDLSTLHRREREKSAALERTLADLRESYDATVRMLAFVIEAKDPSTGSHLERSYRYAKALAGRIDSNLATDPVIDHGFLLHDIGKVGVPDRILSKAGPLDDLEWEVMRTHPMIGGRIVAPIRGLAAAGEIIESHHERFDGAGYPRGLRAAAIPLGARVFAIADSFDAMTSDRSYRRAMSVDEALGELIRHAGTQFDPDLVREFVAMDWGAPG